MSDSRIGKSPIQIPKEVVVEIKQKEVLVKGPLGELAQSFPNEKISLSIEDNKLIVKSQGKEKKDKAFHGLYRALLNNMVIGVGQLFTKTLELVGVGYRASHLAQRLDLSLGYSHNIIIEFPKEVKVEVKTEKGKNPLVLLSSYDKQLLGMMVSFVRALRPPEPYKGKGIRYQGEVVRQKDGKTA